MKLKSMIALFTWATVSFAFLSCADDSEKGSKKEKTEESNPKEVKSEETKPYEKKEIENSKDQYAKDWEAIKKAIKEKDIPGVGKFAGSDAVDAELLINLASDHHIYQVLESYEFQDLKVEKENGNTYHVMYAYSQQNDEPKKELSIYMSKGEEHLVIEYFISKNM